MEEFGILSGDHKKCPQARHRLSSKFLHTGGISICKECALHGSRSIEIRGKEGNIGYNYKQRMNKDT